MKLGFKLQGLVSRNKPNENLVFSPTSISLALALLELGSTGKTQRLIQEFSTHSLGDYQTAKHSLNAYLKNKENGNSTFTIANGLFQRGIKIEPDYLEGIKCYKTQVQNISRDNKQARLEINKWVSDKTKEKHLNFFSLVQ